jgi:hypothetical protein
MIKFFKTNDLINTNVTITTDKLIDGVTSLGLIGLDADGEEYEINLLELICDDNISGSCDLISRETAIAIEDLTPDVNHQLGKYQHSSSVFYTTDCPQYDESENPTNIDGTYKRQVYNSVKNMYYNEYNSSYNIFGLDGFDASNSQTNLSNEFIMLNLKITDAGDRIVKNSVVIKNQSGDLVTDIYDDGNTNLLVSGSHFIEKYEFTSTAKTNVVNFGECGLASLIPN